MTRKNKTNQRKRAAPAKGRPQVKATVTRTMQQPKSSMKMKDPMLSMIHRQICANNDPFCEHARGARLLDGGSIKSLAFTVRKSLPLTTRLNGGTYNGAHLYLPAYNTLGHTANSSATSPEYSFNPVSAAGLTVYPIAYRIISAGILIKNPNAPLTMQGMMRIRTFTPPSGTQFDIVDGRTPNYSQKLDIPLRDVHETAVLCKISDPMLARKFTPVGATYVGGSNTTNWVSPGYSAIMISVDGVAENTVMEMEFFINYELIFSEDDSMATVAQQSPPTNALATAAISKVSSAADSIFTAGVKGAAEWAGRAAATALGGLVGGFFGGPTGATVGSSSGLAIANYAIEVD